MRCAWPTSAAALLLVAGCAATAPPPPPPPPPPQNVFLLLRDPDGGVGRVVVANEAGTATLDAEGEATAVRDAGSAPGEPRTLSREEVAALFGPALAAAPAPPAHFTLHFEEGTPELTAASRAEIPRVVAAVRERASVDTSVVGHTDTIGGKRDNHDLSLRRAQAVAALLAAAGVDPAILEIASHGEENLLVPTADEVAEPRNRRVEVTVR